MHRRTDSDNNKLNYFNLATPLPTFVPSSKQRFADSANYFAKTKPVMRSPLGNILETTETIRIKIEPPYSQISQLRRRPTLSKWGIDNKQHNSLPSIFPGVSVSSGGRGKEKDAQLVKRSKSSVYSSKGKSGTNKKITHILKPGSIKVPPLTTLDAIMGWGQPVAGIGKRGRHCSDENTGSSSSSGGQSNSNNAENLTEEMKSHFGKRPREVSPLTGEELLQCDDNNATTSIERESRLTNNNTNANATMGSGDYSSSPSKNQLPAGCSKKPQVVVTQDNSHKSVITSVDIETADKTMDDLEMQNIKIRTSVPKFVKHNRRRGPRVIASRPRTAYPRKMVKSSSSSNSLNQLSSTSSNYSSSSTSACSSSSNTTVETSSTVASSEEECYVDLEDLEEAYADDEDEDEDVEDDATTSASFDIVSSASSSGGIDSGSLRVLPPIRPSYFPNVPPYINFCLHSEKTEELPKEIQKHMKWRLSSITPIVVKKTLCNSGFRILRKTVEWGGQWGRHMKAALFKSSLKDFQKLNHLPGTFQVGRKDRLWRNIHRYVNKFGKDEYGFMPRTFILPLETKQLKAAWDTSESKSNQLWIVKPPAGARGTGIRVVNRWNQVPKKKSVIVQSYIANPYLINDRKFDLRLYVLVTSFHPLKVYLYNDGLVRFAPVKYSHDSKRAGDRFMHLTNYSINKNCESYTKNDDAESSEGHKWTLKTLWRHFTKHGVEFSNLWGQIEEIVIKTLISAEDPMTTSSFHCLPNTYNGYELFGFDIILDSDLKPWLLEVNISPSLHSSSPLDLAVKGPMIKEVFNIVGFHLPPKLPSSVKKMFMHSLDISLELETPVFDKRIYTNSLTKEETAKHKLYKIHFEKRDEFLEEIINSLTPDDVRQLIIAEDELSQCENFSRIFPTTSTHSYTPYFEGARYYNMLFDAWEYKYHHQRPDAVKRLIQLCRQKVHLQVPMHAGSMISESPVVSNSNSNDGIDGHNNDGDYQSWESTTSAAVEDISDNANMNCIMSSSNIISSNGDADGPFTGQEDDDKINGNNASGTTSVGAVLDNITNNSSRSLGPMCHGENNKYSSNVNKTATTASPTKVVDFPKGGVCF